MKRTLIWFLFFQIKLYSQVTNTGMIDTASGVKIDKLSISAYIDAYYGKISSNSTKDIPYFVSMNRDNELNINLAYIDLQYKSDNFRSRIVPGFGTYINSNYANENASLKNLVEASFGFKLFKKKNIWLDGGVLGSPYTNESAISKDHLVYTRSFAPEYVPYYLSGLKLSFPEYKKFTCFLYLLNGWQQINDLNKNKSIGTQVEYRPNKKNLINWNTYIGNEKSDIDSFNRMRYFSDIYWIYNPEGKFSITSCAYIGNQKTLDTTKKQFNKFWGQVNFTCRYKINKSTSISSRIEYFNDNKMVFIKPLNNVKTFETYSLSLCFNKFINEKSLFRFELRNFYSENKLYQDFNKKPSNLMFWAISNVTVWF